MGADTYTREGDFTDEEAANTAGRSTVRSALVDAEYDAIATALNAHAADLDVVLRDDDKLNDDILEGHEFALSALNYLKAQIGNENAALVWQGAWVTATAYTVGDLVEESGNAYICLVAHTAGATFAGDVANWDLFASKGAGASFPGGASANEVLYYNGAAEAWGNVTAAMAPLLAPKASPTFTGTVSAAAMTLSGALTLTAGQAFIPGLNTVAATATPTFNMNGGIMQTFTPGQNVTSMATSNRAAGKLTEVRVVADGSDRTLTVNANWEWLGGVPTTLYANKSAILSLRSYGTAETDVVAIWTAEF